MVNKNQKDRDNLRLEYQEIGNNIRCVSDLKWREISMLMIVNGALFSITQIIQFVEVIACLGIAFTLIITISHFRNKVYWDMLTKRAEEIETALGIEQFTIINRELRKTWVGRNVKVSTAVYFLDVFIVICWLLVFWNGR